MRDVCIVGGGVAGLSAGVFTARAGLDTLVVDGGESILARNASLENYPGFPNGIDARLYLRMVREQAERAGCAFETGRATRVERIREETPEAGFRVVVAPGSDDDGAESGDCHEGGGNDETGGGHESDDDRDGRDDGDGDRPLRARRLIAASWSDSEYLTPLDVGREQRGSKYVVGVDDCGRTAVAGVYAAGRVAGEPHQAIVAAGHGAKVGLAAVQDSETPFYHDWVAPAGYFTGRDREVPPACEEIDDEERRQRDRRARETLREHLAEPLGEEPTMHPSVDRE